MTFLSFIYFCYDSWMYVFSSHLHGCVFLGQFLGRSEYLATLGMNKIYQLPDNIPVQVEFQDHHHKLW